MTAVASFSSTTRTTTSSNSTTTNARIDLARDRFAQGDFLGAFALCREVLSEKSDDVPSLLLFGRLCILAGDHEAAVNLFGLALQHNPRCETARRLLQLLPDSPDYARAVAIDPDIERHTSQYVFAAPVPLPQHLEAALLAVRGAEPAFADALAALGNVQIRTGRIGEGLASYQGAVALAPSNAGLRLGLAERLRLLGDERQASEQLAQGLARSRMFLEPALDGEELRVTALYSDDFWEKFVALDLLVDRSAVTLEKCYGAKCIPGAENPPTLVFNAIADPEDGAALEWASAFARDASVPVLNHPSLLARTARTYLCTIAPVHPVLRVPLAQRCAKSALKATAAAFAFPLLVRPLDSHRGEGLERIEDLPALERYAAAADKPEYVASEYVDCQSVDGFYRKYRWIFIDGEAYPHHLAISPDWMVHYFSAPMREHAWMRAEEAAFLTDPQAVFDERQMDALRALGRAIGLDYFGVDCALHEDSIVIFEANANMLAHDFFGEPEFTYKRESFNPLRSAFDRMLRKKRP